MVLQKQKKILLTTVLKRMKNLRVTHGGGGVHGFEKVKNTSHNCFKKNEKLPSNVSLHPLDASYLLHLAIMAFWAMKTFSVGISMPMSPLQ
jgi:hypothetical protein